ncbi:hypothetical protein Hanom_Chr04g00379421 [Helianthus anomalus]
MQVCYCLPFCSYNFPYHANEVVVGEKFGIPCDSGSTTTLLIIFCDIRVKGEYRWHRFVLDGRRSFTDYSTVVPSSGWKSGFRASGRAKGLATVE